MKTYFFNFKAMSVCVLLLTVYPLCSSSKNAEMIQTVQGAIEINSLKFTLPHEHVMSNWGKKISETSVYNETALLNQVIPYLKTLKSLGVNSIFDCTTAYFGRRVDLLKRIADSTGVQIITNTGIYAASNDDYVPEFAYSATAEELANIWIKEFEEGIDGTEIKPGFIKLGFDSGTPSAIDLKLFEAGVLTHLATGLTMEVHTGNVPAAAEAQLQLLDQYQVSPEAWVWIHSNFVSNTDLLIDAASKGAWISLDGINATNVQEYIVKLNKFKSEDLLHKVLLSHDGNGFPAGGAIRSFDALINKLIPAMLSNGFTQDEIDLITIENPQNAFTISVKKEEATGTGNFDKIHSGKFHLFQNYPNPFNFETYIDYALDIGADVQISVYDLMGKKTKTLVNEYQQAGTYQVRLDGSGLKNNIYIYQLIADDQKYRRKMLVSDW